MSTFEDRLKNLFNQLNAAEKQANFVTKTKISNRQVDATVPKQIRKQTRAELRQFRGKESIFKRPEAPLLRCLKPRSIPDFRKNPDKWVCYNLDDVPNVSESSNAEAAAQCMEEITKEVDSTKYEKAGEDKPLFKMPIYAPKLGSSSEKIRNVEFKNSVIIYPEHVVGRKEKVKLIREKPNSLKIAGPQLKLDHLLDEADEDC